MMYLFKCRSANAWIHLGPGSDPGDQRDGARCQNVALSDDLQAKHIYDYYDSVEGAVWYLNDDDAQERHLTWRATGEGSRPPDGVIRLVSKRSPSGNIVACSPFDNSISMDDVAVYQLGDPTIFDMKDYYAPT